MIFPLWLQYGSTLVLHAAALYQPAASVACFAMVVLQPSTVQYERHALPDGGKIMLIVQVYQDGEKVTEHIAAETGSLAVDKVIPHYASTLR